MHAVLYVHKLYVCVRWLYLNLCAVQVTPTDHKLNEYYEWLARQHADGTLVMNSSWYPLGDEGPGTS